MRWKAKNWRRIVPIFLVLFAATAIPLTLSQVFKSQEIREKAAEPKVSASPEPGYVKGELLVKLRQTTPPLKIKAERLTQGIDVDKTQFVMADVDETTLTNAFKELNTRFPIQKLEKVFKGSADPKTELAKVKQRFAKEIAEGKRRLNETELLKIDLSKIYLLKLSPESPVKELVHDLSVSPEIEYAELNYLVHTTDNHLNLAQKPTPKRRLKIASSPIPTCSPTLEICDGKDNDCDGTVDEGTVCASPVTSPQPYPNDTHYSKQWSPHNTGQTGGTPDADIDAPEAWQVTQGSPDVTIAIVDTGIDYTHPDLGGCIGPTCKVIGGYDFYNNDADPMDDHGHGTHTAGTAAALTGNGKGVAGVCPNCRLMAVKFLSANGSGTTSNGALSIQFAANNGAKVISNSWGGGAYNQFLQDVINQATALGAVVVASAGNTGGSYINYPAGYENVLSVAATTNNDTKSSYSTWGTWVDISAPGGEVQTISQCGGNCRYPIDSSVLSTMAAGNTWNCWGPSCGIDENGAKYLGLSGTSMAAPHVAGVAGLLFSHSPHLQPAVISGQLKYTGDSIDARNPEYIGQLGASRLNAQQALTTPARPKLVVAGMTITPVDETTPNGQLEPGENALLAITLKNEWDVARAVSARVASVDPYITILQNQSNYPDLSPGSTGTNTTLYKIKLGSNYPLKHVVAFTLHLTFTGAAGTTLTDTASVRSVFYGGGWPKTNPEVYNLTAGVIADLGLDGSHEYIIGGASFENGTVVHLVRAYTYHGDLVWSTEVADSSTFAVGNVDSDAYLELVFSTGPDILILSHTGQVKRTLSPHDKPGLGSPTLADVNNDGILEIITPTVASVTPADVRAYKGDGTLLWTRRGPEVSYSRALNSAVGDLNGDGLVEVVTGFDQPTYPTPTSAIVLMKGSDGTEFGPTIFLPKPGEISPGRASPWITLGDMDGNRDLEILVSVEDIVSSTRRANAFFAFHHDGQLVDGWPKNFTGEVYLTRPVLAKLESDGKLDVFTYGDRNFAQKFFRFDSTGADRPGWPVSAPNLAWTVTAIVGNIDSDSNPEIIFKGIGADVGSPKGLYAYEMNGQPVPGYPKYFYYVSDMFIGQMGPNKSTVIGIIWPQGVDLIDTESSFLAAQNHWPAYLHDNQRSGNYHRSIVTPPPSPPSCPLNTTRQIITPCYQDENDGTYDLTDPKYTTSTIKSAHLLTAAAGSLPTLNFGISAYCLEGRNFYNSNTTIDTTFSYIDVTRNLTNYTQPLLTINPPQEKKVVVQAINAAFGLDRNLYLCLAPLPLPTPTPACTPTLEICDGLDNDCDGTIDEGGVCTPSPLPTPSPLACKANLSLCTSNTECCSLYCYQSELGGKRYCADSPTETQ